MALAMMIITICVAAKLMVIFLAESNFLKTIFLFALLKSTAHYEKSYLHQE